MVVVADDCAVVATGEVEGCSALYVDELVGTGLDGSHDGW